MPQTTSKRGGEIVTTLTASEESNMRVTLAALKYLADREKASKDCVVNLEAVLKKWAKPSKTKPATTATE